MISAVIQDNEESVGPLADSEVARLLSALHNAEFTRSDKHDLAKNSKFRQRSLIEIAAEAKKHKEAIETDPHNIDSNIDRDSTEVENFPNDESDSLSKKSLEAVKTSGSAPEQTIRDIASKEKIDDEAAEPEVGVRGLTTNLTSTAETDGTESGIRGLTTNPTSTAETDGTESGIRGLTSVSHEETDGAETIQALGELTSSQSGLHEETVQNSFETVNEAFERGKTEGISEGRVVAIAETEEKAKADAKGELVDIVDTFNKVVDSLARPKAMQVEALTSSINTTILKLASERAGMQIDELPEAFSERINALVTGITQELAGGKVHLNEDDFVAMKPYLTNLGFEAVANSNLMRGDVTIQFDGLEVHDVAANRMVSHSTVPSDDAAAANTDDENASLANMLKGDEVPPPSDEPDS
ncbi:MAG: hypothetical protein ACJ0BO_05415 [Candidatus Puniceispirillaceae bacterium]